MRRVHWFELEDFDFIPKVIRDGGTDFLDFSFSRMGFYRGVEDQLVSVVSASAPEQILDLCSGGGGGTLTMYDAVREVHPDLNWILTDKYPNESGALRTKALGNPRVRYLDESVDALNVTSHLKGLRTMSGALHHFRANDVTRLVQDAIDKNQPLAFFDVAASSKLRGLPWVLAPFAIAANLVVLFVATLLVTPLIKPFRWWRLLFTYLIPLIPILVAWDGTVSALRAYTPEEVLAHAKAAVGSDRYHWSAGSAGSALYLVGRPFTAP